MARVSLLPVVLAAIFAAGCGNDASARRAFGGELSSSDAVAGAVVDGDRASVYVCGGPATFATATRWFQGSVEELADGLTRDGWIVRATINLRTVGYPLVGEVLSPDGDAFDFTLVAAEAGSIANLYSTLDAGCRTGVVVREIPGQDPAVQGVWCSDLGEVEQVTPGIAPLVIEDGALTVSVERPEGLHELVVRPFDP